AVLAFAAVGVVGWAVFFTYVTNQEKVTSSVVQQMLRSMKSSEELHEYMGDAIRPVPEWWLNGDPWIHGRVNQINGSIDLSFKIKGSKGSLISNPHETFTNHLCRLWYGLLHQCEEREGRTLRHS
ncbi:cytochrome oxidase complex assembly protein 1-domain-containing protein, partial [Schizophyllum commune]